MFSLVALRTFFTPRGLAILAAVVALLIVGGYVTARVLLPRLHRAEAHAERNADVAVSHGLEAQGAATVGNAATTAAATAGDLRHDAASLDAQAHADAAGAAPLPAGVVDRLRAGDRLLCGRAGVACR